MNRSTSFFSILGLSLMTAAACTDSSGPGESSAPSRVAPVSAVLVTGIVGSDVSELPAVRVTDSGGNPVPGVPVRFVATDGGGTLAGDEILTGASGLAKLGKWTLGIHSGIQTVIAYVDKVDHVRFEATASPRSPARLEKITGDNQTAYASSAVGVPPIVRVNDEFGNAVPGVAVRFSVSEGGGMLLRTETLSDAFGLAHPGTWIVGTEGPQALLVWSGSLPVVQFTAIAVRVASECGVDGQLIPGLPLQSTFTGEGCLNADGRAVATFILDINDSAARWFEMHSTDFNSLLELRDASGNTIARNDDRDGSQDAKIQASLAPGRYRLIATSSGPGMLGRYSVTFFTGPGEPFGCEGMSVVKGISIATAVRSSPCLKPPQRPSAVYRIYLNSGETLTATVHDRAYSGPQVEVESESGQKLAAGKYTDYYENKVQFTAPASTFYVVRVYSDDDQFDYAIDFN